MNNIKILPVAYLNFGYNSVFVSNIARPHVIKPQVCPDGFERAYIGSRLKIPVCVSLEPHPIQDDFLQDVDSGPSPDEYGIDASIVMQQQRKDGRIILTWFRD